MGTHTHTQGACDTLGALGAITADCDEACMEKALTEYPVAPGLNPQEAQQLTQAANSKLWKFKCKLLQSGIECTRDMTSDGEAMRYAFKDDRTRKCEEMALSNNDTKLGANETAKALAEGQLDLPGELMEGKSKV